MMCQWHLDSRCTRQPCLNTMCFWQLRRIHPTARTEFARQPERKPIHCPIQSELPAPKFRRHERFSNNRALACFFVDRTTLKLEQVNFFWESTRIKQFCSIFKNVYISWDRGERKIVRPKLKSGNLIVTWTIVRRLFWALKRSCREARITAISKHI